jgi:SAM-dependent methyltransferase
VIDREIAPIWHDRFARLILRNLPVRPGLFALDVQCGPGRMTAELLQRLGEGSRVLALEPDETLIDVAKSRVRPEWKGRVYFKPGALDEVASMAPATYDVVVANLVLGEGVDLGVVLGELCRVTRPGGHVLATLPLWGTWGEVEDIFSEVLRDAGLVGAQRRLERFRGLRPLPSLLGDQLRGLGLRREDFVIEHERLQMLFPSGREFLFAPVIEHGPLRFWKAIIGDDGSPQELFWRLKEAIDIYYAGHVLAVSVAAGLIRIQIPEPGAAHRPSLAAGHWRHYPELDRLWGGLAAELAGVREALPFSDADVDDFDIDIGGDDTGLGEEPEPEPEPPSPRARARQGRGARWRPRLHPKPLQ